MEFTANANKNVSIETSTGDYDRCAIQTHFIEIGEDYIELVERYVRPLWQEGDLLAIAEKIEERVREGPSLPRPFLRTRSVLRERSRNIFLLRQSASLR